jgi:hypothetical protein
MANNCWNWAHIEGSKENLDLLQARLKEAKASDCVLFYASFHHVLGIPVPESTTDVYDDFGTRWFTAEWDRDSDTSATLTGDSAWSPPSQFFRKLSEVYSLTIASEYEEGGCDIGGYYGCSNGEVTRDECYSFNYYRLTQDKDNFMHNLLEDIGCGRYEDYEDFVSSNEDVIAELTPQDIKKIKEQFNQIKK